MKKKIYTLIVAAFLVLSMNAFAGSDTKSCQNADAKQCEIKDACCKKGDSCEKSKCDKTCEKKCEKKARKTAS